ncbi:hypothetical protein ACHAPQ_010371 [Fusarium lateritium]
MAMLKANLLTGGTYSVTFFSDSRLETLSAKLQNSKIDNLIRRISSIINDKAKATSSTSTTLIPERNLPLLDHASATKYIISGGNLSNILITDTAFSALYYSVLALGCLHDGGGSFEPGKGKAWELFSVALALLPSLQKSPNSLVALQAMTTAAVYSLGIPCLSIEQKIMTETARMAQDLAPILHKGPSARIFCRIFWAIYAIEKTSSFHFGRASAIIDTNIITPMPYVPESNFGTFNWILTMARHCRLLSRAMDTLFSPGVCQKGSQYFLATIDQLQQDLEEWLTSIPEEFRPGPSNQCYLLRGPIKGCIRIWVNYLYYSLKLVLLRSRLQITSHQSDDLTRGICRDQLVAVSRSILEIVTYIDVEPSAPLCNPRSPDTRSNLALLDIAGGHFARIEFVSGGSLPSSLISEFTYIAREYINRLETQDRFRGPQCSIQAADQDTASLDMPDAINLPAVTSQDTGQNIAPITVSHFSLYNPFPAPDHPSLRFLKP